MKFNSIKLTIELIVMAQAMSQIKKTKQWREKFGCCEDPHRCDCDEMSIPQVWRRQSNYPSWTLGKLLILCTLRVLHAGNPF